MELRTLSNRAASRGAVVVLLASLLLFCWLLWHGLAFQGGYVHSWLLIAVAGCGLAIGLWKRRPWTRPLGLLLTTISILLLASLAWRSGLTWWQPVLAIVLLGGAAWLLCHRIDSAADSDQPLFSLVLLFREAVYLEPETLADVASRAWNADVQVATEEDGDESLGREQTRSLLIGESPLFFCNHWPGLLLIHNVDAPYFDDLDAVSESVREVRARQALEQHRAWVAVDVAQWFGAEDDEGRRHAYRLIARLLAELADENCLAVVEPVEGRIFPYDPTTEEKLRSDDPLEALCDWYYPPVLGIEADDPEMQAAVNEARRRWPDFVAAFETRHDQPGGVEPPFLVKAPFTDGEHVEYMWVRVTGIENQVIYGVLENMPANVQAIRVGQRVRVRLDNLNDWMCVLDGKPAGAFTLQVLAKKSRTDQPPA